MVDSHTAAVRVAARRRDADEWALVLAAEGLASEIRPSPSGFAVLVAAGDGERADQILAAYALENPPPREAVSAVVAPGALAASVAVSLALLAFFRVTGPRAPTVSWFAVGAADAARVTEGELWRTVTALTLHADFGHVLANAVVGAVFLGAVFRAVGPGLGLLLVLLAGAGGNLVNAVLHGGGHASVGASTAVFGAVGLLTGLAAVRRRSGEARRGGAWVPIAAGLALLSWLGSSARVDLWAHLFGLVCGALLGLMAGAADRRPPGPVVQWLCAAAALLAIGASWSLAFDLSASVG